MLLSRPYGCARAHAPSEARSEAPSQHSPARSGAPDRLGAESRGSRTPAAGARRRRARGGARRRRRAHGARARFRPGRIGRELPRRRQRHHARPGADRLPGGVLRLRGAAVRRVPAARSRRRRSRRRRRGRGRRGARTGAAAHRPGDRARDARCRRAAAPRRWEPAGRFVGRVARRRRSARRRLGLAALGGRRRRRHGRDPRRRRAARAPARAGRPDATRLRRDRGRGALGGRDAERAVPVRQPRGRRGGARGARVACSGRGRRRAGRGRPRPRGRARARAGAARRGRPRRATGAHNRRGRRTGGDRPRPRVPTRLLEAPARQRAQARHEARDRPPLRRGGRQGAGGDARRVRRRRQALRHDGRPHGDPVRARARVGGEGEPRDGPEPRHRLCDGVTRRAHPRPDPGAQRDRRRGAEPPAPARDPGRSPRRPRTRSRPRIPSKWLSGATSPASP